MTETHSEHQPTELALIRVSGADARSFLHAQTTQDINALPDGGRCLAAWLNAKGRVRALFEVIADGQSIWLLLPADNRDYLMAELGRFVLRADVSFEAADTDQLPPAVADAAQHLSDADVLAAIRLGVPEVTAAQREQYVAQMLNLDQLDAISFSKGCYPGQEIVARAANLGAVKRRAQLFAAGDGAHPQAADEIRNQSGEIVGEINRAAASADGYELLAVMRLETDPTGLALADGRSLVRRPLPWDSATT